LCNHLYGNDRCRFISASNPLFVHGLPVICLALLVISEHIFGDVHIEVHQARMIAGLGICVCGVRLDHFHQCQFVKSLGDTQRASEWLYSLTTTFRHSNGSFIGQTPWDSVYIKSHKFRRTCLRKDLQKRPILTEVRQTGSQFRNSGS